jgi:hypothetical protein
MTLCIAWKDRDGIHLASDSRISFPSQTSIDIATKITYLDVKICDPIMHGTTEMKVAYQGRLGIALVGSITSTFSIKESLQSTLDLMQHVPGVANISLDSICDVILKYFEYLSRAACESLGDKGRGLLIVTGYCPDKKTVRAFEISLDCSAYPIKGIKTELFIGNNVSMFGSGKKRAEDIRKNNPQFSNFQLLRSVIHDKSEKSVGGGIQYGIATEKDFIIKGVQDYQVDDKQKKVRVGFYLRGIEMLNSEFSTLNFHINKPYIMPFYKEIDGLINQGYHIC